MFMDTGFWILDTGFWILDFGYWILDTGFWILDCGFWIITAISDWRSDGKANCHWTKNGGLNCCFIFVINILSFDNKKCLSTVIYQENKRIWL